MARRAFHSLSARESQAGVGGAGAGVGVGVVRLTPDAVERDDAEVLRR